MRTAGAGGIRWLRGLGFAVVLGAMEASLVRLVGSPDDLLAVLRQAPTPGADPVTVVVAFLAAVAELLALYLLISVGLHLAATLPGAAGHLAGHAGSVLTVPLLRRALDATVGGVLIMQVAMGPAMPASTGLAAPARSAAAGSSHVTAAAPATSSSPTNDAIVATTAAGLAIGDEATGRTVAPSASEATVPAGPPTTIATFVPLPGWAAGASRGGAAAEPAAGVDPHSYVIRPGDTLWDIAKAQLAAQRRTDATVDGYWRQIYQANRGVLGPDPDYILPGVTITIPSYQTSSP